MKKTEIQKTVEVGLYTLEQFQKMVTGFIPAGHLIDGSWNFSSGLKQQRLLEFADSLKKVFETELGEDLDKYNFENEDFVDVFDSILKKVQSTKSQSKLNAFKGILLNTVRGKTDLAQVYIDLTSSLDEKQIEIIMRFLSTDQERKDLLQSLIDNKKLITKAELDFENLKQKAHNGTILPNESLSAANKQVVTKTLEEIKTKDKYDLIVKKIRIGIVEAEYDFYYQDLISKGLLHEMELKIMGDERVIMFTNIKEFTRNYLSYIKLEY